MLFWWAPESWSCSSS